MHTKTIWCSAAGLRPAWLAVLALFVATQPVSGQSTADIGRLSIEDLMNIEVTSVSKRNQKLSDAAAAVHVVTSEDIRRSGALTIPDALRLVPGVHVGQMDPNKWSVAVRGFGGRYSNKLLVLVDGRSVYTPLISGVFWDAVNVPMDSIERIEIIRGPGATMWGANAVNGVINIITRSATASKGVQVSMASGTEEPGIVSLAAGGTVGTRTAYRADAGFSRRDGLARPALARELGGWSSGRVGLRVDTDIDEANRLTVQSAVSLSTIDEAWNTPSLRAPYNAIVEGESRHAVGFASAIWSRRDAGGDTTVRLLADRTRLTELHFDDRRLTVEAEIQRTQRLGEAQELVMGTSYRRSKDDIPASPYLRLQPAGRALRWQSLFLQDEIGLRNGQLRFTVGTKAEHNDYTGWEVQPNVRGIWSLTSRQSVWAALSRAVRLPSRAEADALVWVATLPPGLAPVPQEIMLSGTGSTTAEVLLAREMGYRYRLGATMSVDLSTFHNRYDDLLEYSGPGPAVFAPFPEPHLSIPLKLVNANDTTRSGAELALEWRPVAAARVTGAHSWLRQPFTSGDRPPGLPTGGDFPSTQSYVRTAFSLPRHVEVDAAVRYVSNLREMGVPSYVEADSRLGFRLSQVNVSVVGRNLLSSEHIEYLPEILGLSPLPIRRSVMLQVRWSH